MVRHTALVVGGIAAVLFFAASQQGGWLTASSSSPFITPSETASHQEITITTNGAEVGGSSSSESSRRTPSFWANYRWPHLTGSDTSKVNLTAILEATLAVPDTVPPVPFREARPTNMTAAYESVAKSTFGSRLLRTAPTPRPLYEPLPGKRSWMAIVTGVSIKEGYLRNAMVMRPGLFNKIFYCRRHQLDLYVFDLYQVMKEAGMGVHPQWAKPWALLWALKHHEWLVWQDNDILFTNVHFSFEPFVKGGQAMPPSPHTPTTDVRRAPDEEDEGPASLEPARDSYQIEEGVVDLFLPTEYDVDRIANPTPNTGFYVVRRSMASVMILNETWYAPQNKFGGLNDQDGMAIVFGCLHPARAEDAAVKAWQAAKTIPTGWIRKHTRIVGPVRLVGGWATLGFHAFHHRQAHHGDPMMHFCLCEIFREDLPGMCGHAIAHVFTAQLALANVAFTVGTHAKVPHGIALEDYLYHPHLAPMIAGPGTPFQPASSSTRRLTVALVSVEFARLHPFGPIPYGLVQTLRSSKLRYVRCHPDLSFDDRSDSEYVSMPITPKEEVWGKWQLRLIEAWLPFFDWVVYLAPDVAIVNHDFDLMAALRRVPDHIDFIAQPEEQPQHHSGGSSEGKAQGKSFDCSMMLVRRSAFSFAFLSAVIFTNERPKCADAFLLALERKEPFAPVETNLPYLSEVRGKQRPEGIAVVADLQELLGVQRLVYNAPGLCEEAEAAPASQRPCPPAGSLPAGVFAVRIPPAACHQNHYRCIQAAANVSGLMESGDSP